MSININNKSLEQKDETDTELENELIFLKKELSKYILNKIDTKILEDVKLKCYDDFYKLIQVATIEIENQTILIKPFEKSVLTQLCSEIIKLNIDLNPIIQANHIKIVYPKITSERRELYIKKIKELGEHTKIRIRNIRKNANNRIKALSKAGKCSQDDEKRLLALTQKKVDDYIKRVDEIIEKKKSELERL